MKKLSFFFSFIIIQVWRIIPFSINKYLGSFLAFLWIDVLRIRRKIIDDNIQIAFPNMTEVERKKIARQSMVTLCRGFFDVFKIPTVDQDWIRNNVDFTGLEHVDKLKQSGQGVLVLTLHFGSGDLAAAIISEKVWPLSLITKRFKSQFLDELWFNIRGRSKTEFIDAHSQKNAFDILSALKKGRAVVFVLDQFMGKPFGVASTFFGRKTGTAYGLALFAKKTKRPILPIYNFWDEQGRFQIRFMEPIDLSQELGEDNVVLTEKFNRVLEEIIRLHPEHWMWVHRRWKNFE